MEATSLNGPLSANPAGDLRLKAWPYFTESKGKDNEDSDGDDEPPKHRHKVRFFFSGVDQPVVTKYRPSRMFSYAWGYCICIFFFFALPLPCKKKKKHLKFLSIFALQICIEMTPEGPVEVLENCTTSGRNESEVQEFEETAFSALRTMMDRAQENDARGQIHGGDTGWDSEHGNHYHENEHDDHFHDHLHLGEDGFFCNPVGKSVLRVITLQVNCSKSTEISRGY